MTTIAYHKGCLAGDGRMTAGTMILTEVANKIVKGPGGNLAGAAGLVADMTKFFAWVEGGEQGDMPEGEYEALIVLPDGSYYLFDNGSQVGGRWPADQPIALGSGGQAALAVLHAGGTVENAIIAACKVDIGSGGRIRVIRSSIPKKRKMKDKKP